MTMLDTLGWAACAISLVGCSMKSDRHLKLVMLAAAALWVPYYALLGGLSGCLATVVLSVRQVLTLYRQRMSDATQRGWMYGLMVALAATTVWTWAGWFSVLPLASGLSSTYAFMRLQGSRLRLQLAASDLSWSAYAMALDAWPHLTFTLAALSLNLWNAYRLRGGLELSVLSAGKPPA